MVEKMPFRCAMGTVLLAGLLAGCSSLPRIEPGPLLQWPQMKADEFGCLLEKEYHHRDDKFNCDMSAYKNVGDPCRNTREYYAGPSFPASKFHRVHRVLLDIHLDWEGGRLQSLMLAVAKQEEGSVRQLLGLPDRELPANVLDISIQSCGDDTTCIIIEGLPHRGAQVCEGIPKL